MSATTTGTIAPPTEPALTAYDRCDRCGAQAYMRATLPSSFELLFCAHHARENGDALTLKGARIYDESKKLEPQPVVVAD